MSKAKFKKLIGYKVLNSFQSSSMDLSCAIKYMFDKFVAPKRNCGPLTVFKRLSDAKRYANTHQSRWLYIYRCEYIQSNEEVAYNASRELVTHIKEMESGTILASKVKILEKLDWIQADLY